MNQAAGPFRERLGACRDRLEQHRSAAHRGLTAPDHNATEQWEASQIWAHLAEFIPYWIEQLQQINAAYVSEPVPFGRTKQDEARIAAIEIGRHRPLADLWAVISADIAQLDAFLAGLSTTDWAVVGVHPSLGVMDAPAIVDRFLVAHIEEHVQQLEEVAT